MHNRDIVERVSPIRVCRTNIHVGFSRHSGMSDSVGAAELAKSILTRDHGRVSQILDQFKRIADRKNLGALYVFDIVCEFFHIPVIGNPITIGILGGLFFADAARAQFIETSINLCSALAYLIVNLKTMAHIFLFCDLEPQHVLSRLGVAVERKTRGIRASMLQRLQHVRQLPADVAAFSPVNQTGYPAHRTLTSV